MISKAIVGDPQAFIESLVSRFALQAEELPLKSRPGARHWHLRRNKERGTLEATYENGTLIFDVRTNRAAPWVDEILAQL